MERSALVQELRWLVGHATAAGADPARVARVAGELVDLLLHARQRDPRKLRTDNLAARVARAHAAGCSIAGLCERFGRSRSQIHRLLGVARLHATDARSNNSTTEIGD